MRGATRDAAPAIVPDKRPTRRITMHLGQMRNSMGLEPGQDPGEPFDIITANGKPTGRVKSRADVHRDGDWHRAIHVWVAGVDDRGAPFLTLQRRSPDKDTWPGRFDATARENHWLRQCARWRRR